MGSIFGKLFRLSTFGESHGQALGAVIDGCPAGLSLSESDIQPYLDRRKPGQSRFSTGRREEDLCRILSGVYLGKTTGAPIALIAKNTDMNSSEYEELSEIYRPGHADYSSRIKYGFRDHRGGGRSSGRETLSRVMGGAVAAKILKELGIEVFAFTQSIGPVSVKDFNPGDCTKNPLYMPDLKASYIAGQYIEELIKSKDSAGGIISCIVRGLPAGVGEPVADKLDAELAKAIMSIGAVKGVEFGSGFACARMLGSMHNDAFILSEKEQEVKVSKESNNAGGILGGISDGSTLIINAAVKPTPSIGIAQRTLDSSLSPVDIELKGRHDPVIVPRAVVVIECMVALTILDLMFMGMHAKMDYLKKIYQNKDSSD